ncbi:hypothetical protein ACJX0J_024216, partial [Zea mays]
VKLSMVLRNIMLFLFIVSYAHVSKSMIKNQPLFEKISIIIIPSGKHMLDARRTMPLTKRSHTNVTLAIVLILKKTLRDTIYTNFWILYSTSTQCVLYVQYSTIILYKLIYD